MLPAATKTVLIAVMFVLVAVNAVGAEPKRVLLLHSYGRDFSPWAETARIFREEVDRKSSGPMEFFDATVTTERFGADQDEVPFSHYLQALFAGRQLDLVVAFGAPAARFVQRHRQQIFPSTPMLFTAVDQRSVPLTALGANDTVVAISIGFASVIQNILRVLPETTDIAVVIGNAPNEQFWLGEIRSAAQPYANRVALTSFNELSYNEMLKRTAALPPKSAIFYFSYSADGAGVSHGGSAKSFASFRAVANAPIFSYIDTNFGKGIVGGSLIWVDDVAQRAAGVATRILSGEAAGGIRTPPIEHGTPKFDWRELQRWNIAESRLPPGSEVHFREPTAWEQYRWQILAAFYLFLAQAATIVWLLYEYRKRQRSEAAAHDLSGRLINAQEDERARLARELHDDITQRMALLAIDAGREERNPAAGTAMHTMRDGLIRLSEDVHALSYRLHPSILEDLGLIEALRSECERFSATCSTRLDVHTPPALEKLPGDIALGIFRIAQEGLRNIARHSQAHNAELVLQRRNGALQLTVKDDGVGFDPAQRRRNASLGHASMRQRAILLRGTLAIDSVPGRGTTIAASIPLGGATT